jgi:hypothetical protein
VSMAANVFGFGMPVPVSFTYQAFFEAGGSAATGSIDNSGAVVAEGSAIPLGNIEEEQEFDGAVVRQLAKVIDILPSLEV